MFPSELIAGDDVITPLVLKVHCKMLPELSVYRLPSFEQKYTIPSLLTAGEESTLPSVLKLQRKDDHALLSSFALIKPVLE